MILAMLLALAAPIPAAPAAGPCDEDRLRTAVSTALAARDRKDIGAAQAAIAPAETCPVASGIGYTARVLAADLAFQQKQWGHARQAMADVGVHAEMAIGARAEFIRLATDRALGDAAGFARDRAAMIAADDRRLAAMATHVDSFRSARGQVTAYDAVFDQGAFHRTTTFILTPDDPAAYPESILLTDDREVGLMVAELNKKESTAAAVPTFTDLYLCHIHSTLKMSPVRPDAAALRQQVLDAWSKPAPATATPAAKDEGPCSSAAWIMPGFGAKPAR